MSARSTSSGVTLLEVLITLAIMGMIATALASLGTTGTQVWARIEARSGATELALARWDLRQGLESLPLVGPDLPLEDILVTGNETLQFRPRPEQDDISGWQVLDWSSDRVTLDGNRSLFGSVQSVQVSFYGRKTPRSASEWFDDWTGATLLPRLIKIETIDDDGLANPPLTIEIAKTARYSEISPSSLLPPG